MDDGDGREGEQKGDRGWGGHSMVAYGKDLRRCMSMKCAKNRLLTCWRHPLRPKQFLLLILLVSIVKQRITEHCGSEAA